jgi:serpin B
VPIVVGRPLVRSRDEAGTEAAAATAVVVDAGSAPAEPISFVVDRPFLFALRDTSSAAIVFLGRITDPSAAAG